MLCVCVCVYVCVASYMCVFLSIVCRMAAGSGSKARWLGKLSDKCIYHWNKEINTMKHPASGIVLNWHDKAGNWHQ